MNEQRVGMDRETKAGGSRRAGHLLLLGVFWKERLWKRVSGNVNDSDYVMSEMLLTI